MITRINNAPEMSFIKIEEMYPDAYILVKITDVDYSEGRERGVALYTSPIDDDFAYQKERKENPSGTIVLTGINRQAMVGGFLF